MRRLLLIVMCISLFACASNEEQTLTVESSQPAEAPESAKTVDFTAAITASLEDYDALKKAFVQEELMGVTREAVNLLHQLDSIPLEGLQAKDTMVKNDTRVLIESMKTELRIMVDELGWKERREAFQMVSDSFFELLRKVRYDGGVVYRQLCPMAFGKDKPAHWLNKDTKIVNPYLPKTMPACGSVVDSVAYKQR
jgi:hypothetical protein